MAETELIDHTGRTVFRGTQKPPGGGSQPHGVIAYLAADAPTVDGLVPFDSTRWDSDGYLDVPSNTVVIPAGLGGLYVMTLMAYVLPDPNITSMFFTLGTVTGYEDVLGIKKHDSNVWIASTSWLDVLDEAQAVGVFAQALDAVGEIAQMGGDAAGTTFALSYVGPATSS